MQAIIFLLVTFIVAVPLVIAIWRFIASPVARAVFIRNLKSYFSGVLGYLFIVAFVIAASMLAFNTAFFANNLATLDQLTYAMPWLLLFLVPAITMTSWSEERKLGTDELLFTLPASDLDILIGKYLSVLSVYTIALAFSITNLYVLARMGQPDWGPIATTYLGYWLAGAALLAAGLLTSSITSSATVAFILGVALCAVPVVIDRIPRVILDFLHIPAEFIEEMSLSHQLRDFGLGMIPLSGILYFVSITVLMLYLNYIVIRKRHWSGGDRRNMGFQYILRGLAVATILIGVNYIAKGSTQRLDLTSEKVYTLSDTTYRILDGMEEERPVTIQAFLSPNVPQEYVTVRKRLLGLLNQYSEVAGSKISVRIVDVEPFSEAADEAAAFGIQPRTVVSLRNGRQFQDEIYLGLVFSSSYDEIVVPLIGPGTPLEYELTRSIRTVSKSDRLTVGVLQTSANVIGDQGDWEIVRELRLQYNVESVNPNEPIDAKKYDVLLAVMPSALPDEAMTNFVKYVEDGHPTLIFDDPYPMQMNPQDRVRIAPRLPNPSEGGGMFGQQAPPTPKADGGRLTRLMDLLHLQWSFDGVVWEDYNPYPSIEGTLRREYLFFRNRKENREAISTKSEITRGLSEILLAFGGDVRSKPDNPYEFTPLLSTGGVSGIIPFDEFAQQSFNPLTFQPEYIVNSSPPYEIGRPSFTAAMVQGEKKGPHVIFVADVDMISDFFFQLPLTSSQFSFDNVSFTLNAIDILAGDKDFVSMRVRSEERNTLEAVEQQTEVFREQLHRQQDEAEKTLESEIEKRQAQFDVARKEIESDTALSTRAREDRLNLALENERRRLNLFRTELEKKLERDKEQLDAETQRKIQKTEENFWLRSVIIPPLPAIILGLGVLLTRLLRERKHLDPRRARR